MPINILDVEYNVNDINSNYFCSDQTNMNQIITTRNYYDSANVPLYASSTNIQLGELLYNSTNCQKTSDFSIINQIITHTIFINYNGIIGQISYVYPVYNSEYVLNETVSAVNTVSGCFNSVDLKNLIVNTSYNNITKNIRIVIINNC
jgi:hypothetical protein